MTGARKLAPPRIDATQMTPSSCPPPVRANGRRSPTLGLVIPFTFMLQSA